MSYCYRYFQILLVVAVPVVLWASCSYPRIANPTTSVDCVASSSIACNSWIVEHHYWDDTLAGDNDGNYRVYLQSMFDSNRVSIFVNTVQVFDGIVSTEPEIKWTGVKVEFDKKGNFMVETFNPEQSKRTSMGWYSGLRGTDSIVLCIDGCAFSTPLLDRYRVIEIGKNQSTRTVPVLYMTKRFFGF